MVVKQSGELPELHIVRVGKRHIPGVGVGMLTVHGAAIVSVGWALHGAVAALIVPDEKDAAFARSTVDKHAAGCADRVAVCVGVPEPEVLARLRAMLAGAEPEPELIADPEPVLSAADAAIMAQLEDEEREARAAREREEAAFEFELAEEERAKARAREEEEATRVAAAQAVSARALAEAERSPRPSASTPTADAVAPTRVRVRRRVSTPPKPGKLMESIIAEARALVVAHEAKTRAARKA